MLCAWCRFAHVEWWAFWRLYCPVCRTLKGEIIQNRIMLDTELIGAVARKRLLDDARHTDYIPGYPDRRPRFIDYDGPERRQREGTIYDRKGYIHNAQFDPSLFVPGSKRSPAGPAGTSR